MPRTVTALFCALCALLPSDALAAAFDLSIVTNGTNRRVEFQKPQGLDYKNAHLCPDSMFLVLPVENGNDPPQFTVARNKFGGTYGTGASGTCTFSLLALETEGSDVDESRNRLFDNGETEFLLLAGHTTFAECRRNGNSKSIEFNWFALAYPDKGDTLTMRFADEDVSSQCRYVASLATAVGIDSDTIDPAKESPTDIGNNTTGNLNDTGSGGGLGTGPIAGIAVGCFGLLGVLGLAAFFAVGRTRRRAAKWDDSSSASGGGVEARASTAAAAAAPLPPHAQSLRGAPHAIPSTGTAAGGAAATTVAATAAGATMLAKTTTGTEGARATRFETTVRQPHRVVFDPATQPVPDAAALRGMGGGATPIAEDGSLPVHISIALDTSQLGCSTGHNDGDVRRTYADTVAAIFAGMGENVYASLVFFSGDEAMLVGPKGSRVSKGGNAVVTAIAAASPPVGALVSRASPKATMRAVNMCIGLLRETPAGAGAVAKRVLVLTAGGVTDGEMQLLRGEANGGRGWRTANCVVVAGIGQLANTAAVVQLGAVAVLAESVEELGRPEAIGLLKSLFAADDPRSVK
jgi:hypothetical protein